MVKIRLPQCRIDIRPSGNGGFARSGLVIMAGRRAHLDLVIMARGAHLGLVIMAQGLI